MKVDIEFFYRLWYNNKHKSYRFKANARFGKHCKWLEPASLLVSLKSLITTKTIESLDMHFAFVAVFYLNLIFATFITFINTIKLSNSKYESYFNRNLLFCP